MNKKQSHIINLKHKRQIKKERKENTDTTNRILDFAEKALKSNVVKLDR